MTNTQTQTPIDQIKFTFSEGPNTDTIVATLPCGCETKVMSRSSGGVNQFGNPVQFTWLCNAHFYEW
jgi:hypothetical protein